MRELDDFDAQRASTLDDVCSELREVSRVLDDLRSHLGMLANDVAELRSPLTEFAREACGDLARVHGALETISYTAHEIKSETSGLVDMHQEIGNLRFDLGIVANKASEAVGGHIASAGLFFATLLIVGGLLQIGLMSLLLWRAW